MKRDFLFDIGSRVIVLDIEATARVVEAFVNVGNQNEYKVRCGQRPRRLVLHGLLRETGLDLGISERPQDASVYVTARPLTDKERQEFRKDRAQARLPLVRSGAPEVPELAQEDSAKD
jgi:hypothetical protein